MAVAVSVVGALGRAGVPFGPADGVGVRRKQGVDHGLQQLAHQIRRRLGEGLAKKAGRVDNMRCGHRDDSSRIL